MCPSGTGATLYRVSAPLGKLILHAVVATGTEAPIQTPGRLEGYGRLWAVAVADDLGDCSCSGRTYTTSPGRVYRNCSRASFSMVLGSVFNSLMCAPNRPFSRWRSSLW